MAAAHIIPGLRSLAVPVASVRPNPDTATRHTPKSIQTLQESIAAFNQYRPIVARESDRVVIVGTGILLAMKTAGYTTIACVFLDADYLSTPAIMLSDSKTSRMCSLDSNAVERLYTESVGVFKTIPGVSYGEMDGISFDNRLTKNERLRMDFREWLPDRFKR